ncbi:MAG: flavodoxin domain-containing protein [Candidatus Saliniplasma sp.]
MRINIIYDSKYGNGKKIAEYVENSFENNNVKVFFVNDTDPDYIRTADLYIFSTPTRRGKSTRRIRKFVKNLKVDNGDVKYGLITMFTKEKTDSLKELERLLEKKGFDKITENLKLKVEGKKGPLGEGFEENLDEFLEDIT